MAPLDRGAVASRAIRRGELLLPGESLSVVFEGDPFPSDANTDWVCLIGAPRSSAPDGFMQVAARPLKTYEPLHALLGRVHPFLEKLFGPGALFHHVGSRLCGRSCSGLEESYWVREKRSGEIIRDPAGMEFATVLVSTVAGIGLAPAVGATLASLATVALGAVTGMILGWPWVSWSMAALALGTTALSVLFEKAAARRFLTDDPREFVLDEVAGQAVAIAMVAVPFGMAGVCASFIAFRFFDVLKPGIEWIEVRQWPGKIVWDDILAGLYAGAAIWVVAIGAGLLF